MTELGLDYVARRLPPRPDTAHKGTMGSLCAVTGSYGYAGAAMLCASAALRSGVGLLYQLLPASIYPMFTLYAPEAVCVPYDGDTLSAAHADDITAHVNRCSAAVVGCGLQNTDDTRALVHHLIRHAESPLLIDADGINALAGDISILSTAKSPIILTPHPREFSRITGLATEEILHNSEEVSRAFCEQYPNTVLVLKSHRTLVTRRGDMLLNTAGNPGMAKGGSGDVLSGIIGSLMAQGVAPFDAAGMGVYIHASAGDIAARRLSRTAMLPRDIIDSLPAVYKQVEKRRGS